MAPDFSRKRVLVLSDNDRLARAIEFNLKRYVDIVRLPRPPAAQRLEQLELDRFDLVVVALSSPSNDPVAALARAALLEHVGRMPMLVISKQPMRTDLNDAVVHMDFPFEIDDLRGRLKAILEDKAVKRAGPPVEGARPVALDRLPGRPLVEGQAEYWFG